MNKNPQFVYVVFLVILASCATGKAAKVSPSMEEVKELQIDSAIRRVKQNSQDIQKYYTLDANKNIIVKAELTDTLQGTGKISRFEVIYDLKNSEAEKYQNTDTAQDGTIPGIYIVPFSITDLETGESKQDKLLWILRKDSAGILLAFDDDYLDVWRKNFDLFDRYNARVTFFVKGKYSPFCIEALQRGHDVGYHTINHLNLRKVSRRTFNKETTSQIGVFRRAGVPLTSFAYPYGLSEPWMNKELLKSFTILRGYGVSFRAYNRDVIRKGYSTSKAVDNFLYKQDEDFEAAIDTMFKTVKFIGGSTILPLTTHIISNTADYGIKPGRLQYLLQAANDWQLVFYRYKDL